MGRRACTLAVADEQAGAAEATEPGMTARALALAHARQRGVARGAALAVVLAAQLLLAAKVAADARGRVVHATAALTVAPPLHQLPAPRASRPATQHTCHVDRSAVSDGGEEQGAEEAFMGPRETRFSPALEAVSRASGSAFTSDLKRWERQLERPSDESHGQTRVG